MTQKQRQAGTSAPPEMISFQRQVEQAKRLEVESTRMSTPNHLTRESIMEVLQSLIANKELAELICGRLENSLTAENRELREEVQRLREEIARLKGQIEEMKKSTNTPEPEGDPTQFIIRDGTH